MVSQTPDSARIKNPAFAGKQGFILDQVPRDVWVGSFIRDQRDDVYFVPDGGGDVKDGTRG